MNNDISSKNPSVDRAQADNSPKRRRKHDNENSYNRSVSQYDEKRTSAGGMSNNTELSLDNLSISKKRNKSPEAKRVKPKSTNKIAISGKSRRKRVTFRKNFVEEIKVVSYKQYNYEASADDPSYYRDREETTKCKCILF